MLKQRVAMNIKKLRELRGLTQMALGEKSGVEARHISKLELGEHGISLTTLENIAYGLGVNPSALFAEEENEYSSVILRGEIEKLICIIEKAEVDIKTSKNEIKRISELLEKKLNK